jgi:hypothetical protein
MRTKFPRKFRCSFTRLLAAAAVALLLGIAASAQAPATIFQLDGKATNSNLTCTYGTPCDSWNLLNGTGGAGPVGTNSSAGHSAVRTFVNGTTTTDAFQGGGSKDFNPLSQWSYSTTNTPNKDTLNAGYAAAYNLGDFDVIFGADRASPNGDANIGIWFFQQSVSLNGNGGFSGSHVNGDVFVISSFTNGGGTSTISVFAWNQPGLANAINGGCSAGVKNPKVGQCADTNLLLLANPSTVCGTSPYCAITNSATTASTWEGNLASPLFFEGGVDITQAFAAVGQAAPCFASFLEETRSSQSTSAVLKDFLIGGFPVCSMSITKSCGTATVNAAGTSITYPVNGVVTNTGIGTLFNVQVIDCIGSIVAGACTGSQHSPISVVNNTTGSNNFGTSSIGANETATWTDSSSSTASSQSDQAYAIAAEVSGGAQSLQSSNTASQTCSLQANSTLTVTKSCSTSLQTGANGAPVSVLVNYGGMVCNTGASQVTGVALTDYPDSVAITSGTGSSSVASGITLGPAGSATACYSYTGSYTPTAIDETINNGTGAGRYFFDDLVTITSGTASVGTITTFQNSNPQGANYNPDARINGTHGFAPARCPICQGSAECTTP